MSRKVLGDGLEQNFSDPTLFATSPPELHPVSHAALMLQGSCDSTGALQTWRCREEPCVDLCGPQEPVWTCSAVRSQADSPGPLLPVSLAAPGMDQLAQHCITG